MASFNPSVGEKFELDVGAATLRFQATEHPSAPERVHAIEGGKAVVFRVHHLERSGAEYALKVMKRRFRDPELERVCIRLDRYKQLPGLLVCERQCLSPSTAGETLAHYPSLAFAILMPWIRGYNWFELRHLVRRGVVELSPESSLGLAAKLAAIVATLERERLAHCDLSPANIILDADTLRVELVDVEDMCGPHFTMPRAVPLGTAGYQHSTSSNGQWNAQGDRFAAALLLTELLLWHRQDIRALADKQSLFAPEELQRGGTERLAKVEAALSEHGPWILSLFRRAWKSASYKDCPPLSDWRAALDSLVHATPLPVAVEPPKSEFRIKGGSAPAAPTPAAPMPVVPKPADVSGDEQITWVSLPKLPQPSSSESQVSWTHSPPSPKRS